MQYFCQFLLLYFVLLFFRHLILNVFSSISASVVANFLQPLLF
jgi:hypothetical protein